jgi:hypothetical protein
MKYLSKIFSSGPNSEAYRRNWSVVFGKNPLRDRIMSVLDHNESRCLDDEDDKRAVCDALEKELSTFLGEDM